MFLVVIGSFFCVPDVFTRCSRQYFLFFYDVFSVLILKVCHSVLVVLQPCRKSFYNFVYSLDCECPDFYFRWQFSKVFILYRRLIPDFKNLICANSVHFYAFFICSRDAYNPCVVNILYYYKNLSIRVWNYLQRNILDELINWLFHEK